MDRFHRPPWLAAIAATLLIGMLAAPVTAAAPANDDLAGAQPLQVPFAATLDMTDATLEIGEPRVCDNADVMDASVWYTVEVPAGYALRVETGGQVGVVMAAIFGPYAEVPSSVGELGLLGCVNHTGSDYAMLDFYGTGTYLIQLTTVKAQDPAPSILVELREGVRVEVQSAVLKAKGVAVEVTFDIVCQPAYGQLLLYTDFAYASVTQRINPWLVARGRSEFYDLLTCDGSTVNRYSRLVTTETVAFKRGIALVEGYAYVSYWGVGRSQEEIRLK